MVLVEVQSLMWKAGNVENVLLLRLLSFSGQMVEQVTPSVSPQLGEGDILGLKILTHLFL